MVHLSGPEGRNIIGDFTEDEVLAFFKKLAGWHLVFKDVDARLGYSLPLPLNGFEEKDRGLDFLFSAWNPFTQAREGILVETKHVKTPKNLAPSVLREYVDTLKKKLDGVRSSAFQNEIDVRTHIDGTISYGVLVLRHRNFELERFRNVVSQLDITKHRGSNVPVIAILTNHRLDAFIALRKQCPPGHSLEFYYPRYIRNPAACFDKSLSLSYLLSDVVFGRFVDEEEGNERHFALSFDEPSSEVFLLLREMLDDLRSDIFGQLYQILFARGDFEQVHLYQQWLGNSSLSHVVTCSDPITILPQNWDMKYDITKEV
jgi:hypothetical protein